MIAISKAVERHLRDDFNVAAEKINLIENGIDLEEFILIDEASKKERRKRFNLGDEPVIGVIARLSDVKGLDILVEAMSGVVSKVPDAKLLLVGEGKMESFLRDRVKRLDHLNRTDRFTV